MTMTKERTKFELVCNEHVMCVRVCIMYIMEEYELKTVENNRVVHKRPQGLRYLYDP